ncbi:MAG: GNAT family N-acetyltransferase [Clostridia bacterium]|nr:GNAT family N-acetyltransferase [Clostridia bacterium]
MLFYPKEITLKDGRTAILKSPALTDAAEMLAYIKQCCGETEFLVRYPEEYSDSIEAEEAWIRGVVDSPAVLPITCYVDGRIAGSCELRFHRGIKAGHRATVGISILRAYWDLGIGSAMFGELIAAARAHGTEIMELDFIEGNHRARHLYEKYGFRVVAEKPRAFKLKDGTYRSEFSMQNYL